GVAFNILSGDEEAVFRFANIINRQDIRVIQGRSRAGFDLKSPDAFVIGPEISAQNFQSDQSFETGVLSEINVAHPAPADPLNYLVRSNLLTRELQVVMTCDELRIFGNRRHFEKLAGFVVRRDQRSCLAPEVIVT